MKPRQIEAFRAVMELGSVTAAADRLHVTQPAISKLIMELELSTGLQLFQRKRQRFVPTQEARLLLGEVERVFFGMDRLSRFASELREERRGVIRIGSMPSVAVRILPQAIGSFSRSRPNVYIAAHVRTSPTVADWAIAQQIDLGISLLKVDHPSVDIEPLAQANAVCILPAGHPLAALRTVTPKDLQDVPCIGLGREDHAEQMISRVFETSGYRRNLVMEANLTSLACNMVAEGAGVAIVDPYTAAEFISDELLARPFFPEVRFQPWLLLPAHRPQSLITTSFAEELKRVSKSYVETFQARITHAR